MTALTEDRNTERRDGEIISVGVAATAKIFAGSIVCKNSSGYAVPGSDTAGLVTLGRAEEYVDNSAGADGDKAILVRKGCFKFGGSGFTVADIGKPLFVSDDQTVALSTANSVCAGIFDAFESATDVWVDMRGERAAAADADSVAADVATIVADFNDLLAKLRSARLIAS